MTLELGLRYSLWQPWGVRDGSMASFQSQFYDPSRAAVIDPRGGFIVSGDRFNGITLPGDSASSDALAQFPQLADLQRLYHGVPNGFSETAKGGLQPRLGMAYAINDKTTVRSGVGRFLNRVQINTTAAYGFNPPLSEMVTVVNGNVDLPAGATTRNFPLVMSMQDPNFTNPSSWAWNATLDRELPWTMRAQVSYVGRDARNMERARNINQLVPGTLQANPGINTNALRPYKGYGPITLYETTGGVLDAPTTPPPNTIPVGTGTLAFQGCANATLAFNFTGGSSSGKSGSISLVRIGSVPSGCTS